MICLNITLTNYIFFIKIKVLFKNIKLINKMGTPHVIIKTTINFILLSGGYMKKIIKIILIIIGIILIDSIQALLFNNNPIIGIDNKGMKKEGIFVDTYYCNQFDKHTVIKGFSYSCSYNGSNYKLIDKTKHKINFTCAEALESFYEDYKYIYYWECLKNKYMIIKYNNGYEETIKEGLKNNHININDLNKFDIDYIKIEK